MLGSGGQGGGEVLGVYSLAGEVLGLASTGSWLNILIYFFLGLSSLSLGVYLRRRI